MRMPDLRFVILFAFSLAFSAHAQQRTWIGPASGGLWSNNANWNPTGKPIAGDKVLFNGAVTSTADLGAVAITQISMISSGAGIVINGAVTLNASVENINIDLQSSSTAGATIN